MASRDDHLAWAAARALAYLDSGDCAAAVASMLSDLGKWEGGPLYPDTILDYIAMNGSLFARQSTRATRRWIEGLR